MNRYRLILGLVLASFLLVSCRPAPKRKLVLPVHERTERADRIYEDYRHWFFKYFLDEDQNRFNGCVAEKVFITAENFSKENYLDHYQKIKFADATIYAGMSLFFLVNDYRLQMQKGHSSEAQRTFVLLKRVLAGLRYNDSFSANGPDGFYVRDTVDQQKGIAVESDFINAAGGSNEMSGSQTSGIMYGLHFALLFSQDLSEEQAPGIMAIREEMKDQMHQLISYLQKHQYRIQSEINLGEKTRRGPYVIFRKWVYQEINDFWQNQKTNHASEMIWSAFYKSANWFCKIPLLSVRKYNELKAYTPKNYHGKSYAALYCQMLETALCTIRHSNKDSRRWQKYAWRYQNGLVVSLALLADEYVDPELVNMLTTQLHEIPTHLPNNISKDHNGWNADNRWIRLLHRNAIAEEKNVIQVYNGLDFLCAYSAYRLWLLKK